MSVRWTRWAPLTGLVFVVLFVVSTITFTSGPNSDASGASVVTYYVDHQTGQNLSAYGYGATAVFGVLFAAVLSSRLRPDSKSGGLPAVGFAGGILIAVGLLVAAGGNIALTDVPTKISPAAEQALNVAGDLFQYPLEAGVFLFLAGYGVAIVCANVLPRWLGWAAIVLAIVAAFSFVGPVFFFGGMVTLAWFAVVSILLFVREWRASTSPEAAGSGA